MTTLPKTQGLEIAPKDVHDDLWRGIEARLQRGDTLVRPRDFQTALEADFTAITGTPVGMSTRRRLANEVVTLNREHPERYVAIGVQNSARRAFQSACLQLRWDPTRITRSGPMAIARFKSYDSVRALLSEVGAKASAIDADDCIQHAIRVVLGESEPIQAHDPAEPIVPVDPVLTIHREDPDDGDRLLDKGATAPSQEPVSDEEAGGDDGLTVEERREGALIGRIEMRVAGTLRKVPRKLVPAPDGSGDYLMAQRDPETGELEPVLRRGATRRVSRGIDGVWRESD